LYGLAYADVNLLGGNINANKMNPETLFIR